jgi:hypothetical protein
MDRLVSIPKRVSGLKARKELTAISTDVFISIPKRGLEELFYSFAYCCHYTQVE